MTELLILLALVLAGGVLAGAEIAVVTARRARLLLLAEAGSHRAKAALHLRENPERFLASVQVGITLLGAIAAAFGGTALARRVEPLCRDLGCGDAAPEVAFAVVVVFVTWVSVVFGELVPKSIALRLAERYALLVARPMLLLGQIARPAVWLLTASSNLVLRPFHDRTNFVEAKLTREDLEHMVEEAATVGDLDVPTRRLMSRALEFTTLRVDDVMVHRRNIMAVPEDATMAQLREVLLEHGHHRAPVYRGTIDEVTGYVLRDDVLACLWDGREPKLAELRREPYFVPTVMPAERALRELQTRRLHLAIVVEEHGGTAGLVTLEDLLEELVGEIFNERDRAVPPPIQREPAGTFLLLGIVPLRDVWRELRIELPERGEERTVGGLLVTLAEGRVPAAGERFEIGGMTLEVVEASARRVRVARLHTALPAGPQARRPAPQ
jgi:putative hemolysin